VALPPLPPLPPPSQHHQLPPTLQPQQPTPAPTQADKRVLEILKQNIEARDQSSRPQIAEAPSTPAMVFSTPIRKEPSTTPLKKTDYYYNMAAERTAVTPFPKKIDYYMDRAYSNAPRIRTKAERKQVSTDGSSSGMRMSSPMAAATAISPHPFLPSNNNTPQTKQEQIPLTETEAVITTKVDIKRDPSPIKSPDQPLLNNEEPEKDDDEDFWTKTCDSFVVQLAETQEKKKTKTSIKRKSLKEQQPLLPKRKYTKRIKIEPVAESEHDNKHLDLSDDALKPTEEIKLEKSPLQEKVICEDKPIVVDSLKIDKENKTKIIDQENKTKVIGQENKTKTIGQENKTKTIGQEKTTTNDIKIKEQDAKEEFDKVKPKRKRMTFAKPTIKNSKIFNKETKKELKMKLKEKIRKEKKEAKKEELRIKELKKAEKREAAKKELQLQKLEKKELASKEDKKGSKKDDKCDLKKNQVSDGHKKDLKKEGKTAAARKRAAAAAAEKENLTKNHENTTRRSAAVDTASKFNPRQSLRRKNSLKDYTFAFDEMLDDAFAHLEADKIPVKRRRKCGATLSPPSPAVPAATGPALPAVKKPKDKDNETMRMRLRSRTRPLLAKQEPKQTAKKNKANAKNKKNPKAEAAEKVAGREVRAAARGRRGRRVRRDGGRLEGRGVQVQTVVAAAVQAHIGGVPAGHRATRPSVADVHHEHSVPGQGVQGGGGEVGRGPAGGRRDGGRQERQGETVGGTPSVRAVERVQGTTPAEAREESVRPENAEKTEEGGRRRRRGRRGRTRRRG